jgi:hypothetical protein
MRTNIEIDDELLAAVQEYLHTPTKKATIERALKLLLQAKAMENLRSLGPVEFWPGYDYKEMRKTKSYTSERPGGTL